MKSTSRSINAYSIFFWVVRRQFDTDFAPACAALGDWPDQHRMEALQRLHRLSSAYRAAPAVAPPPIRRRHRALPGLDFGDDFGVGWLRRAMREPQLGCRLRRASAQSVSPIQR